MSRKKIEDIKPPSSIDRSSFRGGSFISRYADAKKDGEKIFTEQSKRKEPVKEYQSQQKKRRPSFIIWVIAVIAFLVLIIAASTLFEQAILKITPQQKILNLNESFVAESDALSGGVPFEIMVLEREETREVRATEISQLERKASGKIIIFNNFDSLNQRLIKNTRFETPDGLIYRIRESVVISGRKKIDGKIVPGSIEVIVYADESGEKYNISLTDFTIPGFSGTPRFEGFYARSKTEMTRGFSGVVKTVSDKKLKEIKNELHTSITQKLFEDARAQTPDNFVLFNDAIIVSFNDESDALQRNIEKDFVSITEKGILTAVIFEKEELSMAIAEKLITTIKEGEKILVTNIESLSFTLEDQSDLQRLNEPEFKFVLIGYPQIVWIFDEEKLKEDLLGKPKGDLKTILSQFPSITKAEIILRPFWKRSFPNTIQDIKIEKILQ